MNQPSTNQLLQLALQNHDAGRIPDAERLYRQILAKEPNHPDALHLLGVLGAQIGQTAAAIDLIRRAIAIKPTDAGFHNDLGNCLRNMKQLDQAVDAYGQAIRLKPDYMLALNNLGNALCDQGKLDEGIAAYRQALKLQRDFAGLYNNLGKALRDKHQLDESLAIFRQGLQLKPDYAELHHNFSLVLLLKGDYAQGWPEHEWRLRTRTSTSPRREFPQPKWDGSDLNGRTILLHSEQGLGDSIQFARYAPLVASRGGKVIMQCQSPLCRLFHNLAGVTHVIANSNTPPDFDVHCPMLSLPCLFNTTVDAIPASIPYLQADGDLTRQWTQRLSSCAKTKIGLVWAGAAGHATDHLRSISPALFAPLAKVPGVELHSLQKGAAPTQLAALPPEMHLIDHTAQLDDFADTAALMANLDLIISVDTAVAHLAGALGKRAWLLLQYTPDWRWLLDRDDSPWYPTVRLFRQKFAGNWAEVIERVVGALR